MKKILSLLLALATALPLILPVSAAQNQSGYTVTLVEDKNAAIGTVVSIPVTIGHSGGKATYNAFDMTFSYNPKLLKLTTESITGMTVTGGSGTVRVQRFGKSMPINDTAFTLEFQVLAAGTGNVQVSSSQIDTSDSAIRQDAPQSIRVDPDTKVTVKGYPVTLPEIFEGEPEAEPKKDYTFTVKKDPGYDYTVTATVNGKTVKVIDNGDGTYTIKNVSGKVVVTVHKNKVETAGERKVWITPYVEWDDATIYLIAVTGDIGEKYTYCYRDPETRKDKNMYFTEKYASPVPTFGENVWVYLQLVKKGETLTHEKASARITTRKGGRSKIEATCDLDGSKKIDQKDVQLILDIYNGKFDSFKKVSMQKLLRADVSVDGVINVADAAAVAYAIP